MLSRSQKVIIVQGSREFSGDEIEHIKTVVEMFPRLSRKQLAQTLCEHLGWLTASGAYKETACLKLLEKLEDQRVIELPEKSRSHVEARQRPNMGVGRTKEADRPTENIVGRLADVRPVSLDVVHGDDVVRLWNEIVDRHHYLGYQHPFGCTLRYFVVSGHNRLGCLLLAGAAKSIGIRDRWIGWTKQQRLRNLPWVINNTRFLVFPWVRVRDLASHVLGQLARRVQEDWFRRWGYRPVLMETFVDPLRYLGTCYRAAGWICLGYTTGKGLRRPGRSYKTLPKRMFVRPLTPDFRALLCSDSLKGRVPE